MLDEDGNPCAVRLNVGDYRREFVEVVSDQFDGLLGKVSIPRGAKRGSRLDSSRQAAETVMGSQERHHELLRKGLISVADAYGAKEDAVPGILMNEVADTFPQQGKRSQAALVFRADERPSHLQRAADLFLEAGSELEQRAGVKPLQAGVVS